MSYCTVAAVKAYLGGDVEADDALLTTLLSAAQKAIDSYCGRIFEASADTTRYFDALADVDESTLYFDADLAQVTSVVNGDGVTVSSTAYKLVPSNHTPKFALKLLVSGGKSWTYDDDPEGAIAVTGRWAYSVTAPADITQACTRLTAYLYQQRGSYELGANTQITESGLLIVPAGLPKDVQQMLEPYRRRI